jgi:hypothetical protein
MFSIETAEGDIVFSFGTGFTWRVKAGHEIEMGKDGQRPGLHASRDTVYRTSGDKRQQRSDRFLGMPAKTVSSLSRGQHHRPRAATPASP